MSYFMTSSGVQVEEVRRDLWALIPASEAQTYIRKRIQSIAEADGGIVYFVDDTKTCTSDDIVCDAENLMNQGNDLSATLLGQIIDELLATDHCIRIWLADSSADSHLKLIECSSKANAESVIKDQLKRSEPIHIRIKAPGHDLGAAETIIKQ